jgi:hydroxymethylpyrimidine pyrophosphatase-like HAD family hydrolase
MRYTVLACDYDGTLAHHGRVSDTTVAALEQLLATGRKLVLVSGRELHELLDIFPALTLFEWAVLENGALLYRPSNQEEKLLAEPPPPAFVEALRRRNVTPLSVGKAIVATWQPHETAVLQAIREQQLELQVIFNKKAVMVLPAGVTKATGLAAALKEMGLSFHEAVGVGDAENDQAFLGQCECSAAVANALPTVKERADLTTPGDHGVGVTELIDRLIASDLAELEGRLTRHHLLLGSDEAGEPVRLLPYGRGVLIAGPSGSGKSTVTTGLLERLAAKRYQFCIIDPEGDYEGLESAITLGTGKRAPEVKEVLQILAHPDENAVVNLVGLSVVDRPGFFLKLLPPLLEMRSRFGRPHWLILDEAHHLLPASWKPGALVLPADWKRLALITVHPDQVHPAALAEVDTLIAVGNSPDKTIESFCQAVGQRLPDLADTALKAGEVLLWQRQDGKRPRRVKVAPSRTEHHRHTRKYAEGELPPDASFYFRGPEGKLNLRAQNLMLFMQLADGVDDQTWLHHLGQGDYSRWFRERIKDDELAAEAVGVEHEAGLSPAESRARIRKAIESRYTLPAAAPLPMPGTPAAPKRQ